MFPNLLHTINMLRRGTSNQNPYIEEEQTTQWPKENKQKDKQRSAKHTSSSSGNPPYVQGHRIINAF